MKSVLEAFWTGLTLGLLEVAVDVIHDVHSARSIERIVEGDGHQLAIHVSLGALWDLCALF